MIQQPQILGIQQRMILGIQRPPILGIQRPLILGIQPPILGMIRQPPILGTQQQPQPQPQQQQPPLVQAVPWVGSTMATLAVSSLHLRWPDSVGFEALDYCEEQAYTPIIILTEF